MSDRITRALEKLRRTPGPGNQYAIIERRQLDYLIEIADWCLPVAVGQELPVGLEARLNLLADAVLGKEKP